MDITSLLIADGVDLYSVKTDRFKTGKVLVTIALPLEGDIAANAILPYILRRSCRKYPDFTSLNGRLDYLCGAALGAAVSKLGEAQLIRLSISAIDDRFALENESIADKAVELLFDLIFDPKLVGGTFPEDDLAIEKRLMLERRMSELDDKRLYAFTRCHELMCENEPFGKNRFGETADIESLTPARVFAAWRKLLEMSVIRVVIAGSGDVSQIGTMLKDKFLSINRRPCSISTQFIRSADTPKYFSEEQPVKQGKLVMGYRCGMSCKDDYDTAMTVMSDIFGGGTYSKLFSNVREKMSLCYYCSSRLDRDKGIMTVQSGIETENEEKAKKAISEQLDAMKRGDFLKETFNASLLSLNEMLRGYEDSPDDICTWYSLQLLSDTTKTPQQRAEEFNAVTVDEVIEAARNITLDTVFMLVGTEAEANEN